jgi:hypothetical protein
VNEASRKRYEELHAEWEALNRRFENMVQTDLTALNRKLADAGVGAVRTGSF